MQADPVVDLDPIARAVGAAEHVWDPRPGVAPYEPGDERETRAAVQRLGELFAALPPSIAESLDGARRSGSLISSDRLQGLAEIVQNADDSEASEVRLLVTPAALLVSHDGNPVRLRDVLGFATPWLSTKTGDAHAIGRFGIGLAALQSLSTTIEVHCAPYHFRIGDSTLEPVELPDLPAPFREPGWTTLRIPLKPGTLQPADAEAWLDRWDDSALLFLRHVTLVRLLDQDTEVVGRLALSRGPAEDTVSDSLPVQVRRRLAQADDGRSWATYSADLPAPSGLSRAHKATASTTPVAVALPLQSADGGQVHAGLPVARTRSPLFANAQFDPLTSRTDFADTAWNQALVGLVADVWSVAVLDLFARDPQAAWRVLPVPDDEEDGSGLIEGLEAAAVAKARRLVAARLSFAVPEHGQVALSALAVEAEPLEGILREDETARLAGLGATLPMAVRDPAGRWRLVLDDWRSHGADLPEPVGVERALEIVGDAGRPAGSTIALVAAALTEGLDAVLLTLPCVIAHDGQRLVPPDRASPVALSVGTTPLAEQLGLTTRLHPAHLAPANGAPEVLAWLGKCGALLDGFDDGDVVRRLAAAGRSGRSLDSALSDGQLRALRDAFERIDREERVRLGPDVGSAVRLETYKYDADGHKNPGTARAADSYLPRTIDRERDSFAAAAGPVPGLTWVSDSYARTLRSEAGREGLGPLRFLRLLGAETAPRLLRHWRLRRLYQNDPRRGLSAGVYGSPPARTQAMRERGAEYTLGDLDSPDLLAVIADIARERQAGRRRQRASALLAALGRAWDRRLSDFAQVDAAEAYHRWRVVGRVPAFWLARAGNVAWLDDESGTPRKPSELRLRTPGAEAIYGAGATDYLRREFEGRRALLSALGVAGDPTRADLVGRLRELRSDSTPSEEQRRGAALVYHELARGLGAERGDSDLTADQVRAEFQRAGLLLTNLGWLSPRRALAGPPIFRDRRPFAPAIPECEPLWRALGLRTPSASDCLEVLRQIARGRKHGPDATEEGILLDTLRALSERHAGRQRRAPKARNALPVDEPGVDAPAPRVRERRPGPCRRAGESHPDVAARRRPRPVASPAQAASRHRDRRPRRESGRAGARAAGHRVDVALSAGPGAAPGRPPAQRSAARRGPRRAVGHPGAVCRRGTAVAHPRRGRGSGPRVRMRREGQGRHHPRHRLRFRSGGARPRGRGRAGAGRALRGTGAARRTGVARRVRQGRGRDRRAARRPRERHRRARHG